MAEVVGLNGPKLYVAYADWHWATTQMARFRAGADVAIYGRPANHGFRLLKTGERFVLKAARNQIANGPIFGDARYVDCLEMAAKTAWRLFGDAVGHPSIEAWLANLAGYMSGGTPRRSAEDPIVMIVLEKLRFLHPVDWLPEPLDWKHGIQAGKGYAEDRGEGRELALALDHILGRDQLRSAAA